jgi:hypothetical protein
MNSVVISFYLYEDVVFGSYFFVSFFFLTSDLSYLCRFRVPRCSGHGHAHDLGSLVRLSVFVANARFSSRFVSCS